MLANFTPGHQAAGANYVNNDRALLLFIAGGRDNIVPASVNKSNAHHYAKASAVTEYREFPDRSHYTLGQPDWEEVAHYALSWATHRIGLSSSPATRP